MPAGGVIQTPYLSPLRELETWNWEPNKLDCFLVSSFSSTSTSTSTFQHSAYLLFSSQCAHFSDRDLNDCKYHAESGAVAFWACAVDTIRQPAFVSGLRSKVTSILPLESFLETISSVSLLASISILFSHILRILPASSCLPLTCTRHAHPYHPSLPFDPRLRDPSSRQSKPQPISIVAKNEISIRGTTIHLPDRARSLSLHCHLGAPLPRTIKYTHTHTHNQKKWLRQ